MKALQLAKQAENNVVIYSEYYNQLKEEYRQYKVTTITADELDKKLQHMQETLTNDIRQTSNNLVRQLQASYKAEAKRIKEHEIPITADVIAELSMYEGLEEVTGAELQALYDKYQYNSMAYKRVEKIAQGTRTAIMFSKPKKSKAESLNQLYELTEILISNLTSYDVLKGSHAGLSDNSKSVEKALQSYQDIDYNSINAEKLRDDILVNEDLSESMVKDKALWNKLIDNISKS